MTYEESGNFNSRLNDGVDLLFVQKPITILDEITGHQLQLHQQPPADLTVAWTDPPRKMVCLEPWTSPRQSLISGDRLLELNPNQTQGIYCKYVLV